MSWILALCTITGSEIIRRKIWWGWAIWIVTNICWIVFYYRNKIFGSVFLYVIFTFQAYINMKSWRKKI